MYRNKINHSLNSPGLTEMYMHKMKNDLNDMNAEMLMFIRFSYSIFLPDAAGQTCCCGGVKRVDAHNRQRQQCFGQQRAAHAQHLSDRESGFVSQQQQQQQQQKRIDPGHRWRSWHARYMPKSVIVISITQGDRLSFISKTKLRCFGR